MNNNLEQASCTSKFFIEIQYPKLTKKNLVQKNLKKCYKNCQKLYLQEFKWNFWTYFKNVKARKASQIKRFKKYFDTYYFLLINFENLQNNHLRFLQNLPKAGSKVSLAPSPAVRRAGVWLAPVGGEQQSPPLLLWRERSQSVRSPRGDLKEGCALGLWEASLDPRLRREQGRSHRPTSGPSGAKRTEPLSFAESHLQYSSSCPKMQLAHLFALLRARSFNFKRSETFGSKYQKQKWQKYSTSKNYQIIKRNYYRSQKMKIFIRFFKYFKNAEILDLRIPQKNYLFSTISDFFCQYSQISKLGSLIHNPSTSSNSKGSGQRIAQIQNISLYRKATNFLLNNQSILYGQYGNLISQNERLCTVFYSQPKTGDIVQGIPKIEQILEVRVHKSAENFGSHKRPAFELQNLQKSVVSNIQRIYGGQGIYISDKHIEIIVRQMTSNALILEPGQTGLLCDEIVSLQWIERINSTLISNKVIYEPILMGMTQTCLEMSSFLSAASFQETTRVLSRAALQNQIDFIRGIKQNVILGNLIPIGTGCF